MLCVTRAALFTVTRPQEIGCCGTMTRFCIEKNNREEFSTFHRMLHPALYPVSFYVYPTFCFQP